MAGPLSGLQNGLVAPPEKAAVKRPNREVLMFSFLGPKCYACSSYPHPAEEAVARNPSQTRDLAISDNAPRSLLERIASRVKETHPKGSDLLKPKSPRPRQGVANRNHDEEGPVLDGPDPFLVTLQPCKFFMHITSWYPPNINPSWVDFGSAFDGDSRSFWLVYSRTQTTIHRWQPNRDPTAKDNHHHPTLGRYVEHLLHDEKVSISHLSVGVSTDSFFVRQSDQERDWCYRFHGLPEDCDLAIQDSMAAGKIDGECPRSRHHWKKGRIRAITLGADKTWILYRDETAELLYSPQLKNLAPKLAAALEHGIKEKYTINQVVLNPYNGREYVLAYNNGEVYYCFHESFDRAFQGIVKQWWLGKGIVGSNKLLHAEFISDDYYPYKPPFQEVAQIPTPYQPTPNAGPSGHHPNQGVQRQPFENQYYYGVPYGHQAQYPAQPQPPMQLPYQPVYPPPSQQPHMFPPPQANLPNGEQSDRINKLVEDNERITRELQALREGRFSRLFNKGKGSRPT